MRVGIIADDLTGAGDTAVQFVRAGWQTELQLCTHPATASVVAVTTDSRALTDADAAAAVTTAVRRLRAAGVTHLYKKIDSTLRGHLAVEIDVALRGWAPRAIAIVCPAFPGAGRTLIGGSLLVHGVPVEQTAAANDPVSPVSNGHLPTLLRSAHLARRPAETPQQLADEIRARGPVVVVDAAHELELRTLAHAVAMIGADAIPVGSAGLARHLATAWATSDSTAPTVVIVTSQHDVARRQAAAIVAAGGLHLQPPPHALIHDDEWALWSMNASSEIERAGEMAVLSAPPERHSELTPTKITERFADIAARLCERRLVSGVVVTGGDGARSLVDALRATGIALEREVVTGIPVGTLIGGRAPDTPIVTKAGAFGDDDALLLAADAIRARRRP